jgi:hypothetical protein
MYKFIKINEDEFKLEYDKRTITFKRDVETAQRIQSIDSEAFMMALADLSKQGYTVQNNPYIVTKKVGNKEIVDESNWNYIIDKKKEEATVLIMDELFVKCLNFHMKDLFYDMGINLDTASEEDLNTIAEFETEFILIMTQGKLLNEEQTPSTEA